ncbi:hypothetical protein [Aquicella lusitana]|uniref:Uncharacterized protein n=1 Tax=Aquicella lusitana TaxID=254246 RepID=A0A370GSB6_9COXI|nr:hypothetical protein [Aquicella lusitana]RDI46587.1 hypothetical protein C8D86_105111 [Aquicella lusitana]VVC74251.1 hypothetical protein AQULUS_20160 [Aquicella lusitana]
MDTRKKFTYDASHPSLLFQQMQIKSARPLTIVSIYSAEDPRNQNGKRTATDDPRMDDEYRMEIDMNLTADPGILYSQNKKR